MNDEPNGVLRADRCTRNYGQGRLPLRVGPVSCRGRDGINHECFQVQVESRQYFSSRHELNAACASNDVPQGQVQVNALV